MRLVLLALLLIGCDKQDADDGFDFTPPPFDEQLHEARCSYYVRCGVLPDMESCSTVNVVPFRDPTFTPSIVAAIRDRKMIFDEAKADECLQLIATRACERTPDTTWANGYPEACSSILVGTVLDGGICGFGRECVSGYCSAPYDSDPACTLGLCIGSEPPPLSPENGHCPCESGLYCGDDGICRHFRQQGEICSRESSGQLPRCADGLGCVGDTTPTSMAVCEALPTLGQPCPNGRCRDEGTTCNSAGQCARVGLPGDVCVDDRDCSRFSLCDANKRCARGPNVGEPCRDGYFCVDANAFCDGYDTTATCRALLEDGSFCADAAKSRHSSWCESGECVGSYPHYLCGASEPCF